MFLLITTLGHIVAPAQYVAAALNGPLIDPALAAADSVFRVSVADLAEWTRRHPAINRLLVQAYFTLFWQFLLIVPVLGLVLRDRAALWEYAFHFHVARS